MPEREPEVEREAQAWIEAITGEVCARLPALDLRGISDIPATITLATVGRDATAPQTFYGEFDESLKDGIILCKLINAISPGAVPRYSDPARMPFIKMENITKYLKAVRKFGVDEYEMFGTADLYESKNIRQVASHVHALGRTIQTKVSRGEMDWPSHWPHLGIKVVEKRNIEFTEEQLRRARAQPSLMNLGSSEAGRKAFEDVLAGKGANVTGEKESSIKRPKFNAVARGSPAPAPAAAPAPAPTPAPAALPAGWTELMTEDGRTYYYAADTGVTQWEVPTAPVAVNPDLPEGWTQLSTDDGRAYYYHVASGETQWEKPSATAKSALPAGWRELTAEDGRAYYYHEASNVTQWEVPTVLAEVTELPPGWETYSADDGRQYYYHAGTGETTWDRPTA